MKTHIPLAEKMHHQEQQKHCLAPEWREQHRRRAAEQNGARAARWPMFSVTALSKKAHTTEKALTLVRGHPCQKVA
jgi:hypothetical protein